MALKFIGSGAGLLLVGQSELTLSAADIEQQIKPLLPMEYQNALKVKEIAIAFLEADQGVQVTVRGVATIPTNPVSVTCGFGFSVRGTLRFDNAASAVYFEPREFGQVSILPGEDMPVVESVVSTAFGVVGTAARGVGKGVGVAAGAVGGGVSAVGRGAGWLMGKVPLPKFVRRSATATSGAIGSAVGTVTQGIGSGVDAVLGQASQIVIAAARVMFSSMPVYRFKDDELGRQAKQLVDGIAVKDGMLRVQLSSARHSVLTRWRYVAGAVVLLGTIGALAMYFY